MTDSNWGTEFAHPRDDPRSVNELISAALSEPDEDLAWDAVGALHWRGSREVLDEASRLCLSFCPDERGLSADILGQLGVPDRTFPDECVRLLLNMLADERNHDVLRAILIALGHLRRPEAIGPASRFRHHAGSGVRSGAVFALMGSEDPRAIEALIDLTNDEDVPVRDWATFALGSQIEVNTLELREALVARLSDPDEDTRGEAIVGLARRGDRRVLPALHETLAVVSISTLEVEAASLIGEPDLHPQLVALRGRWDVDQNLLEEAIQACSPRPEGTG